MSGRPEAPSDVSSGGSSAADSRCVCPACERLFRDPRLLPCLHSLCAACVERLEPLCLPEQEDPRGPEDPDDPGDPEDRGSGAACTVLCPVCDTEVELPAAGAAALSPDHLALDAVFQRSLSSGGSVPCDLCSHGQAELRCEVCGVNLCEFCSQAHRRQKRTASHSVRCLRELRAQGRVPRPVLCALHPAQELRLFCEPCDRPVCLECAATSHRDHRCCPAHSAAHRHGNRIRELVAGRLRPRLQCLEEALCKVEISQQTLQEQVEASADEVRAFARGYVSAVETHCAALLRHLEELRVQRRNQLHLQGAQLRQALSDARGGAEFAERLLTLGSDAQILSAKGVALRRLGQLAECGYDPAPAAVAPDDDAAAIRFAPAEPAGDVDGFPLVGVVQARTLDPTRCTVEGEGVRRCVVGQRGLFTLVCRDSAGEPLGRGGEHVVASVVHREKKNCTVETAVVDHCDGTYSVAYTPREAGSYSVWVCLRTQHVKGSPFVLTVTRKLRRHRGTFHCCTFCSSGGAKEAICGCTGTMPGGFRGCGHGHKGHPGKPHWSCCGSTAERSECLPPGIAAAVSPHGHLRTVEL